MGEPLVAMKLVLLTLVLCGAAFAAPRSNFLEDDQLVPEEELSWNDAEASVAELMQAAEDPKSGKDQCYKLADSTEADVKANVKAQQGLIDAMDNGSECPKCLRLRQGKLRSRPRQKDRHGYTHMVISLE